MLARTVGIVAHAGGWIIPGKSEVLRLFLSEIPSVPEIQDLIIKNLLRGYGVVASEVPPYGEPIRFDVLGINRNKREIRIFEIKSCRQDFVADKKWQKYLPFCTHFAFAAPRGVISPDELPDGVGLVEVWNEKRERWNGEFWQIDYSYTRKCKKLQDEIPTDKYISLLEAIVMRLLVENGNQKTNQSIQDGINHLNKLVADVERQLKRLG